MGSEDFMPVSSRDTTVDGGGKTVVQKSNLQVKV